jgi:hypothetical protein
MSEYQYYEFRAIDRPLDQVAQQAMRAISSRAQITRTRFTNHYEWGDFKGDPSEFMEQWFDLHLYFANWGTRRLMMRVPERFLDRAQLGPFLDEIDWVTAWTSGNNLIVDIHRECDDADEYWADERWADEDSEWLRSLAPLRDDVIAGDLRLFYLLWLIAVQDELIPDDQREPLPGIGPLTAPLQVFAEFFGIDPDLLQAAAEADAGNPALSEADVNEAVVAIPDSEKTGLLLRLLNGDTHVAADVRRRICTNPQSFAPLRTAGDLSRRAQEIREARGQADALRREAERLHQLAEAEKARRARLDALRHRGERVWDQIEEEIERRNASAYDRAVDLLADMQALALENGRQSDFDSRLASIRARHEKKARFIERLRVFSSPFAMEALR